MFPYLILDARYEKVREAGVIASQAVMIAIGIDWDGRREVLAEAAYQRCYYVPRKVDGDCLQELRWLYDRRDLAEARAELVAWIGKWQVKYPQLVAWMEESIEETFTCIS